MQSGPSEKFGASLRRPRLSGPSLSKRLSIQRDVIVALMTRNLMAKYGRGNLGFLWLIVEPTFLVAGVITLWSFLYPEGKHGIPVAAFVLSSYMPLTMWRHLATTPRLLSGSFGLLYFRRITVFDIVIARALTEIASVSAAGLVVYFLLLSVGIVRWIYDPTLVLAGWLMMCWFGFSAGCLIAGLSEKADIVDSLIQPIQYLLLPISGVFFMVSWLPKSAQDLILLVPQVHIYEMFRAGFFEPSVQTHYSIGYIVIWTIVQTCLGLWAVASSRERLTFR